MNSIAEMYTLQLNINGASTYLGPQDMNISLSDSIYSIYPKAVVDLKDSSGIMINSRFSTLGVEFTFTIGYQNKRITLPFIVDAYQVPEQKYMQFLNGTLEIEFIHSFLTEFVSEYKAYENTPSDIVDEIIKNRNFNRSFIERTSKLQEQPYYNPGYTFKNFVEKILIPNSTSTEYGTEPYFCFIDAENNFHYETYLKMLTRRSYKTLIYRSGKNDMSEIQKVLEFRPFSLRLEKIYPNLKMNLFNIDEEGDLNIELKKLSVLDNNLSPIPIKGAINSFSTFFNNKIGSVKSLASLTAEANLNKKGNNLLDRIAVTTFLDVTACSGKIVSLDVDIENEDISEAFSGDYLIEGSTHIWDVNSQKGYTQMILSRQKTNFPIGSKLVGGLFK